MDKADKWIREELVNRILQENTSAEAKFKACEVTEEESNKHNWQSVICCVNITYEQRDKSEYLHLIVKLMEEDAHVRKVFRSKERFLNETHFYTKALPLMLSCAPGKIIRQELETLFPRSYYASCTDDEKSLSLADGVIALENLKYQDYTMGNQNYLDLDHLTLAVECLGSFHAMSYFMKEKQPEEFHSNIVLPILETFSGPDNLYRADAAKTTSGRVVKLLEKELPRDSEKLLWLKKATEDPYSVFQTLLEPQEPFAVLCHGDFLRNNLLFRYSDSGSPTAVKILDFQTLLYASPTIDLSVLLFTNTTHETRMEHMDTLLTKYHSSVVRTVAALSEEEQSTVAKRYSHNSFLEDFRQHALFGFFLGTLFTPFMLAKEDDLREYTKFLREDVCSPGFIACAMNIGGEATDAVLLTIAKDFLDVCFP